MDCLLGVLELQLEILNVLLGEVAECPDVDDWTTGSVEVGEVLRVGLALHRVGCVELPNHRTFRQDDLQTEVLDLRRKKECFRFE